MRGFAERADVEEVLAFLRARVGPLAAEPVGLLEAAGRVLAGPVRAAADVPGFRRAAMDGYAVRGEDTFGASDLDPLELALVGEAMPGRPFPGTLEAGQAVRIMTGAPVPEGADAVAMAEICEEREARVEVRDAVPPRKNVGAVGEDIRAGDTVLREGRRLRPQDAGLLASIGAAEVACVRRPRVALVVTGDELLPPGSRPEGARIVDSNSVVLSALVARDGGELLPHAILPDRAEVIDDVLRHAEADVLLVSGGSSVGKEDHAPRLVASRGTLDFHGVAMRPSSPAGVGRLPGVPGREGAPGGAERWVFLLPGNPVSCLCAYEFFAGPTLRGLGGRPWAWPHRRVRRPLGRKIVSAVGRVDYVRVAIEDGCVVPLATSGASILSSTVRADGCVVVPRGREGMAEGETVEVRLYDEGAPDAAEDGA
jgi:molybdopterin molybdotransferase